MALLGDISDPYKDAAAAAPLVDKVCASMDRLSAVLEKLLEYEVKATVEVTKKP